MMKGIRVEIMGIDCTNHGVTSDQSSAFLIVDGGYELPDIPKYPVLKTRKGRAGRILIAVKHDSPGNEYPMFGGHFIYSDDDRFPSDQPIHVHDRYES